MAWRSQIERNRKQIKLLDEVIATQTGSQFGESDAMELCSVDFSLETMQKCKHFDGEIYQTCKELLPAGSDFYDDADLFNAAELIKKEKLPLYRFVNQRISSFSFFSCSCYCCRFFD